MLGIKDVGASGSSDIDSRITFSKAECWGDVSSVFSNLLAGTEGAGLFLGISSSWIFGKFASSCVLLLLTQQAQQKYLPQSPIWQCQENRSWNICRDMNKSAHVNPSPFWGADMAQ